MNHQALTKFAHMLQLQSDCNDIALMSPTAGGWVKIAIQPFSNIRYGDALWVEAGELLTSYGYKWWKHQTPDIENVKMELVDIFHFGMSLDLREGFSVEKLAGDYHVMWNDAVDGYAEETGHDPEFNAQRSFRDNLRRLVCRASATSPTFFTQGFFRLCLIVGIDLDELYTTYVGKNVLNVFRNRNGYTDGTYIKTWAFEKQDGGTIALEDNVVLAEIIRASAAHFSYDSVYESLTRFYAEVKEASQSNTAQLFGSNEELADFVADLVHVNAKKASLQE